MGLAPYGDPEPHLERMRDVMRPDSGLFKLGLEYFAYHREGIAMTWSEPTPVIGRLWSDRMVEAFGPAREPRSELTAPTRTWPRRSRRCWRRPT